MGTLGNEQPRADASAALATLIDVLREIVGTSGLLLEDDVRARHVGMGSRASIQAHVLVRPASTAEVVPCWPPVTQPGCPSLRTAG
ncbi:hypothetical protein [Paraburkholderia diazotrophica]|uniref:Uncharacterized protein n=1 Tax=Paraburkholderia diazotrophica TaxID=667676 RepID=A0A1H7ED64_9BURK|nr:hypothetical protein [Paraburkholderia diazotrophica]SEK11788.1 hypothetical protein SAMN05192539_105342 [Paraburkholderia diazotrophica]